MLTVSNHFIYTSKEINKFFSIAIVYFGLVFLFSGASVLAEDAPPPPSIEFSLPTTVVATEKFDIEFSAKNMSNLSTSGSYFVKFVAFPANKEDDPYHGCTVNGEGDACLGYTSGWSKFPEFKRNDEMALNGKISVWVKNADDAGDFKGYLKFALTDDPTKSKNQVKSDSLPFKVTALPKVVEEEKKEEITTSETEEEVAVEDPSNEEPESPSPSDSSNPPTPSNPPPETLRSLGEGGSKPKTVYTLPATLSAIPVSKVLSSTSAKEATVEAEATPSAKQLPTNYVIFAIIAVVGFVIGLVAVPKFLKK